MAKLQYTYRTSATLTDEFIDYIKDGVEKAGSFPKFVDSLVAMNMEKGLLVPSGGSNLIPQKTKEEKAAAKKTVDTKHIEEMISETRKEILAAILNQVPTYDKNEKADTVAATALPVPAASPSHAESDISQAIPSVTREDLVALRRAVSSDIVRAKESEIAKLDKILEIIEQIKQDFSNYDLRARELSELIESKAKGVSDEIGEQKVILDKINAKDYSPVIEVSVPEVSAPVIENTQQPVESLTPAISPAQAAEVSDDKPTQAVEMIALPARDDEQFVQEGLSSSVEMQTSGSEYVATWAGEDSQTKNLDLPFDDSDFSAGIGDLIGIDYVAEVLESDESEDENESAGVSGVDAFSPLSFEQHADDESDDFVPIHKATTLKMDDDEEKDLFDVLDDDIMLGMKALLE